MKKCKTCNGFGMWAFGVPSPVGRMDAMEGTPTIPCPECKADRNPLIKNKKTEGKKK